MNVAIVTPAPRGSRKGNRVTAQRWAKILTTLGHRVVISTDRASRNADVLIALHANKSASAVQAFSELGRPIAVALTGTDLYVDAQRRRLPAMDLADRLIVLQSDALSFLAPDHATKADVVPQSVVAPPSPPSPRVRTFDVCVVGHMRRVKDPLRTALASRQLPDSSRIAVLHAGGIIDDALRPRVEAEVERNPRYRWLGELSPARTLRVIARSRAMVISSRAEGGAHVVSEALVVGTPVLASRISGNIGMLGEDYPAYFDVGDTGALARLMHRVETDEKFRRGLRTRASKLGQTYARSNERVRLAAVVTKLMRRS